MSTTPNRTNTALDTACASIGRGAWWHGHVVHSDDGDEPRSFIVIELDTEPDEHARLWAAEVEHTANIEAESFADFVGALAADLLDNPNASDEDMETAAELLDVLRVFDASQYLDENGVDQRPGPIVARAGEAAGRYNPSAFSDLCREIVADPPSWDAEVVTAAVSLVDLFDAESVQS